jgi:hypothetical protein
MRYNIALRRAAFMNAPHTGPSNHLQGTYFGNALKLGVVLHKTQFSECAKLMNRYMKFICGQQTNQ